MPELIASGVIGVLLGVMGPFGSYLNGPTWERIAYWGGAALIGTLVYGAAMRRVLALGLRGVAGWAALGLATLVITVPFAFATWQAAHGLWPELHEAPEVTPSAWFLQVLLVAALFATISAAFHAHRRRVGGRSEPPRTAPGLLGAAPHEILCLQMEDHYVRVHTAGGSRLVLTTLSQALQALDGAQGLRTHRSWWVARRAVASAVLDSRNLRLELTNGLTVPVARSAVAAVRSAGWI